MTTHDDVAGQELPLQIVPACEGAGAELDGRGFALGRYAVNLNQAVSVLHQGEAAPVWLLSAVAGCVRATERVDALTVQLSRRLA